MQHFEYCVDLMGIDHVAFGPTPCLATTWRCTTRSRGSYRAVDGVENPAEEFPNIVRRLVKHDYSDDDINKVLGGNIMRVLKEVWWKWACDR
jgi:membrane dipeptidase